MADIATEGGHWYYRTGEPCYEVPKKSGDGVRNTTVRDAREMNLVPSVTGITNQLDKPGLVKWSAELMDKAWSEGANDQWARWLELRTEARDRGTAVHTAIERALEGKPHDEPPELVSAAIRAMREFYEGA